MSNRTLAILASGTLLLAAPATATAQSAAEGYGAVPGTQVVPPVQPETTPPAGVTDAGTLPGPAATAPQEEAGVLGERDSGTAPATANATTDGPTGVAGARDAGAAPVSASEAAPGVAAATADEPGGSLPFTGMDLLLVALGGALLMAVGFTLVHVNRKPSA